MRIAAPTGGAILDDVVRVTGRVDEVRLHSYYDLRMRRGNIHD
jgi:hypothetical protein